MIMSYPTRSPSEGRRFSWYCFLLLCVCFFPPPQSFADADKATRVKSAYLFNFLSFVRWPESASGQRMSLCTLGGGSINQALLPVQRKRVRGQAVVMKQLRRIEEAEGCRILFIGESEEPQLGRILATLADRPVLTVSDMDGFADRGGMIGFVFRQRRVRLEVDLGRVRASGLEISSKLLEVAVRVHGLERGRP